VIVMLWNAARESSHLNCSIGISTPWLAFSANALLCYIICLERGDFPGSLGRHPFGKWFNEPVKNGGVKKKVYHNGIRLATFLLHAQ
jgi:hypothetical protein